MIRSTRKPSSGRRRRLGVPSGVPWYPVVIAATIVIAAYVDVDVHAAALLRPLVVVVVGTLVVQVVLTLLLRDSDRAAIGMTLLLVLLKVPDIARLALALVLVAAIGAAIVLYARMHRRRPTVAAFNRVAAPASMLLLLSTLVTGVASGTVARTIADLSSPPRARALMQQQPALNIHLLMLDGYPRADTLQRVFGYDNGPFLRALERRGFEIAANSWSNYMWTEMTLSSMLHMQYVETGTEPSARRRIADNPVFDTLRRNGYRIAANVAPWESVRLRSADEVCGDGDITEFEVLLLESSAARPINRALEPAFILDRHRRHVESAFACLHDIDPGSTRLFTLTHVPSPHFPVAFRSDGSPIDTYFRGNQNTFPSIGELKDAYLGQLRYINARALEVIAHLVEVDPEAAIVVMSDHGSEAHMDWNDAARGDLDERFGILFATRTPGRSCVFAASSSPVNLFPQLFNEYLGTHAPLSPDRAFVSQISEQSAVTEIQLPRARVTRCEEAVN